MGVCLTAVWVIHSSLCCICCGLLWDLCAGHSSRFGWPFSLLCISDLCVFLSLVDSHSFLMFVCLLSMCHRRPHTFPNAECVIVALLSSLLTVFFNGFPDELGHCSQEAVVGPNYCLSVRRATSDDFLPVTLRVIPIIPEQQTRRHMFTRFFTEVGLHKEHSNSKQAQKDKEEHCKCSF